MMGISIRYIILGIGVMNISSCMVYEDTYTTRYQIYTYDYGQLYPQTDYRARDYNYGNQSGQSVVVPDSYHVGEYHSPVSFKDRDRNWVNSQNPQGYTIQIADDEKAAYVAQKLYKAPKNDRMAQVKYYQNGKTHYKVYMVLMIVKKQLKKHWNHYLLKLNRVLELKIGGVFKEI